jgi:hypothetical protein
MMIIDNRVIDALYNLSIRNTEAGAEKEHKAQKRYARGVLVGVVTTLMAVLNESLEESCKRVKQWLPVDVDDDCIPTNWEVYLK